MEIPNINDLLKVYLGADANGGYQPIGCDERLRSAFPDDHSRLLQSMAPYLDEDHLPDWSKRDLIQEMNLFIEALEQKFPDLDGIGIRALANRWSFGYR